MIDKVNAANAIRIMSHKYNVGDAMFTNPDLSPRLCLIGVRAIEQGDVFNDVLFAVTIEHVTYVVKKYAITTDPGVYYLNNPLHPKGTLILAEGVHKNLFRLGKHRGLYTALVQANPTTVIRDNDKDNKLDFDSKRDFGMFGINMHRATANGVATKVGNFSAGCQVFKNADLFNEEFIPFVQSFKQTTFDYVLLNESDFVNF